MTIHIEYPKFVPSERCAECHSASSITPNSRLRKFWPDPSTSFSYPVHPCTNKAVKKTAYPSPLLGENHKHTWLHVMQSFIWTIFTYVHIKSLSIQKIWQNIPPNYNNNTSNNTKWASHHAQLTGILSQRSMQQQNQKQSKTKLKTCNSRHYNTPIGAINT